MTINLNNFNKWLFSLDNWQKQLIKVSVDTLIVPGSLLLAFALRLENHDFLYLADFYIGCAIATTTAIAIFASRGLYSTFTRHVSIEVAITILAGSLGSALLLLVSKYLANIWIPLSVPLIYITCLFLIATSIRFSMRALGQSIHEGKRQNVAIYGAGAAGTQLMQVLKTTPNYRIRQFIDDDSKLQGRSIAGIRIESFESAKQKFKSGAVDTLLLAMPKVSSQTRQRVSDLLTHQQLSVKTIPTITSLISGVSDITELQDINIEDLLGREPVQADQKLMSKTIEGKSVLVTGAGGSIGSELCRQIINWGPTNLILLDISEFSIYTLYNELEALTSKLSIKVVPLIGSVQEPEFVGAVMKRFNIDTVYHAAAYKHVPLMEMNVMQCISNNVLGTYNIAKEAVGANVSDFILISTDKAVNPTNFMGASKRFAELVCQSLAKNQINTRLSIVRFGNVLGSSGSVVPLFKRQIANREPITITHKDITRYFMTIPEAAQLVIQAAAIAKGGDMFVLDMGKSVKILDLAKKMITLSGLTPVMADEKKSKPGEIPITIIGLRSGEKMQEELSYSANLIKTSHPRIMTADEPTMSLRNLEASILNARLAIDDGNHQKLFQIIASITDGVSNITTSTDLFLRTE